jgi:tetratricopeptide (TPR) repeat protein
VPPHALRAALLLALALAPPACDDPAPAAPRLATTSGVDPLVLERIEAALGACARGEPGARLELAKVYDANGLQELAAATYEQCLATGDGPPATVEYLRGVALASLGRAEEALLGLRTAQRLETSYAPARWRAGELLLELGRVDEARGEFEAALELDPRSVPATLGLARVLLLANDPSAAVARLEALAEAHAGERFVQGLLARAYRALGREEEARRALAREERATRVSLADPRSAEVGLRTTGVLAGLRAADEALARDEAGAAVAILEQLRARVPGDEAVQRLLGRALVEAGDFERARAVLEACARTHPDEYRTELFLGLAHQGRKDLAEARLHLRRAVDLHPFYGPARAALGELELRLAHFPEAEAELLRALECGRDDLRTRILLTQAQLEQAAYARAAATAEETRAAFPNAAAAWAYVAEARAGLGDLEAARAALAETERRNPEYERLPRLRKLLAPR